MFFQVFHIIWRTKGTNDWRRRRIQKNWYCCLIVPENIVHWQECAVHRSAYSKYFCMPLSRKAKSSELPHHAETGMESVTQVSEEDFTKLHVTSLLKLLTYTQLYADK